MPTLTAPEVEEYLLALVSRETGRTVRQLRDEEILCPSDPPWDSEMFVHFQGEIEIHFGVDFDPVEVERHSRSLGSLARFIVQLQDQAGQATA
jgi:hypothetical protein